MESLNICPECGNTLSPNTPDGFCAACLMMAGLHSTDDQTAEFVEELLDETGSRIGRYKLLEQIGEGGFGVVFMAEQLEPVRRRVALKVIKPGMDSRQIVARFEAERQALAMMDHENIARVLDAGATKNGRPYFVMELVRGVPITEYCDRGKLPPRDRLALMINVCRAIQHAHQKGIIHRDVKPSNVLVTLYDGRPVPKVIDFGVAKAVQQPLTDKTMFTRFGQVMGTLEYMSPEQAEMSGLDIDTRGDIYSLGVLMYELLTGSTPLNRERLQTAAIDEVLRLIREEEPERPSLRLDHSTDEKRTISNQRGMVPEKLGSILRGELDWIVMKALEKDRSRRYGTANDFAADIQRFLDDEPVIAAPPSAAYRFRKFINKNRAAVVFASVLAAVVLVGLATSSALYFRSESLRRIANQSASQLADESARLAKSLDQTNRARIAKTVALAAKEAALRERTTALKRSNALRLAAESALQLPQDPGLALRLAYESLRLEPDAGEANSSLINAINRCHEIKTVLFDKPILDADFSSDGKFAAIRLNSTIEIWDLKNAVRQTSIETHGSLNLTAAEFSPDGTKMVVLTSGCALFTRADRTKLAYTDRVARIFDVSTGKELQVLRGHKDRIASVDFSDDGKILVTGSWDGTARVWSVQNGRLIHVLDYDEIRSSENEVELQKILSALEIQSKGFLSIGHVLISEDSKRVQLVPLTGRSDSILGYQDYFKASELDPEIERLDSKDEFSGGGGGTGGWSKSSVKPCAQVFSIESGEYVQTLAIRLPDIQDQPPQNPLQLEANAVDNEVSVIQYKGLVPTEIARLLGHQNEVIKAEISPTGKYVFSADRNSLRIWTTTPLSFATPLIGHESSINCVDISRDGQYVATGSADGTIRVWRSSDGVPVSLLKQEYDFVSKSIHANLHQDILDIQFDSLGEKLLSLSSDRAVLTMSENGREEMNVHPVNVIRVWDWNRQSIIRGWPRHRRSYMRNPGDYSYASVSFSQDEKSVVAVDGLENGQLKLRENGSIVSTHSITGLITTRNSNGVRLGPCLAARSWRIEEAETNYQIVPNEIGKPAFLSRDGRTAIVQDEEHCRVIDTSSGKEIGSLPSDTFRSDRRPVFSASGDQVFVYPQMIQPDGFGGELWSLKSGKRLMNLEVPKKLAIASDENRNTITSVVFNSDGSKVAVSLHGGWVVVWTPGNGKVDSFLAHAKKINQVEFSSDGRFLATSSSDRTARIWLADKLTKILELGSHESEITSIAFSPNNDFAVTIGKDETAWIWPLDPMPTLQSVDSMYPVDLPRKLTIQEQEQFELTESPEI